MAQICLPAWSEQEIMPSFYVKSCSFSNKKFKSKHKPPISIKKKEKGKPN